MRQSSSVKAKANIIRRLRSIYLTRTPVVFPTCHIRPRTVPILSQASLVAHCRLHLLPEDRSEEIMDHSNANGHWDPDVLHCQPCPSTIRLGKPILDFAHQRMLTSPLFSRLRIYICSRSFLYLWSSSLQLKVCR